MSELTVILNRVEQGDPLAAEELLPLVYEELRKLAAARMANEAAGHTLQPTALVHEAWLRLAGNDAQVQFANHAHFFAAAAEAMHTRKRNGARPGSSARCAFSNSAERRKPGNALRPSRR